VVYLQQHLAGWLLILRVHGIEPSVHFLPLIRPLFSAYLLNIQTNNTGTAALVTALKNKGISVETFQPDYLFDVTNANHPLLSDHDCVIHLKGMTFGNRLSNLATEQALADMVNIHGGCYIGAQWLGFARRNNYISEVMDNLILGGYYNGGILIGSSSFTYEQIPAIAGHPLLDNIPSNFTFTADAHDNSPRGGGSFPSGAFPDTINLMKPTNNPHPSVMARELGSGRVIYFSWAANYYGVLTLQDANVQQLYVNAVKWGSKKN
jgi:hypothetical protein